MRSLMPTVSTSPPVHSPEPVRLLSYQRIRSIALLGVPESPAPVRAGILVAILIGAATVGASAAIHLHLWLAGYRHIARIGPLFLAQSISGFVLTVALVLFRRVITVLVGAIFQAASVIGLVLSATVGFLGIHDGLGVPWATDSIIVELVGFVVLGACGLAMVNRN
jgi:hypothetical protein